MRYAVEAALPRRCARVIGAPEAGTVTIYYRLVQADAPMPTARRASPALGVDERGRSATVAAARDERVRG